MQPRPGASGSADHRYEQAGGHALPQVPRRTPDHSRAHREDVHPHRSRGRKPNPCNVSGYLSTDTAIDIGADTTFWHPSLELAQAHAQYAPTYSYRFDFAPPLMRWVGLDATHGLEMFAVFGIGQSAVGRGLTLPGGRQGLRAVTDAMQGHWLHFAKHASPRSDWPSYDAVRRTMIFDATPRVETDPRAEQRRAWAGYAGYRNYTPHQVSS